MSVSGIKADEKLKKAVERCESMYNKSNAEVVTSAVTAVIKDKTTIVLKHEIIGSIDTFRYIIENLVKENECMYIVMRVIGEGEGKLQEKIAFVSWCPDLSSVSDKMLFASSKKAMQECIKSTKKCISWNDRGDIDVNDLVKLLDKDQTYDHLYSCKVSCKVVGKEKKYDFDDKVVCSNARFREEDDCSQQQTVQ